MIIQRKASERGHVKLDWLNAYHSFSFGSYFDPKWMRFSKLRVLNEDLISSQSGFPSHTHANMEIITFVIEGELEHKDSMGNKGVIKPNEIQVMSAGRGIEHSEFNPQKTKSTKSLQVWIEPKDFDIKPAYQKHTYINKENELISLISNENEEVISINQEMSLDLAHFRDHSKIIKLDTKLSYWIQCFDGEFTCNHLKCCPGDGIGIEEERSIYIQAQKASFLLFKLP